MIFLERFVGYKIITYICDVNFKYVTMPELLRLFGLRFLFYSNDHEPLHVHVVKGQGNITAKAKFTLDPVELVENQGLSKSELKMAESVIEENKDIFAQRWNEFFNNNN